MMYNHCYFAPFSALFIKELKELNPKMIAHGCACAWPNRHLLTHVDWAFQRVKILGKFGQA